MILSDRFIKSALECGRILIAPLNTNDIQPASVDLHLSSSVRRFDISAYGVIDTRLEQPRLTYEDDIQIGGYTILQPGEFILGSTSERVFVGHDIVGQLGGKSSLARIGIIIHATAGFIDPGFDGQITLEITNLAPLPVRLYEGMKIAQIVFEALSTTADRPYGTPGLGSKYQRQVGATAGQMHKNFAEVAP